MALCTEADPAIDPQAAWHALGARVTADQWAVAIPTDRRLPDIKPVGAGDAFPVEGAVTG